MNEEQLLERIAIEPTMMVGKPILKDTRLPVEQVLALLAHGTSMEDIERQYRGLTRDDIQACILFAARGLSTRNPPPPDLPTPGARQPPSASWPAIAPQPLSVAQRSRSSRDRKLIWTVICLCALVIAGMFAVMAATGWVMYQMIHDVRNWKGPSDANSAIMDSLIGIFGEDGALPTDDADNTDGQDPSDGGEAPPAREKRP
jgi:uncharacterized protein (DUF433 family)